MQSTLLEALAAFNLYGQKATTKIARMPSAVLFFRSANSPSLPLRQNKIAPSDATSIVGSHFWSGFTVGSISIAVFVVVGAGLFFVIKGLRARLGAQNCELPIDQDWDSAIRPVTHIQPSSVPQTWRNHIPLLEDAGDAVARILATSARYGSASEDSLK